MNNKMVRVISALALSITMGVTAVAGAAQAAGASTLADHIHDGPAKDNRTEVTYQQVYSEYHLRIETVIGKCSICKDEFVRSTTSSYEDHTLYPAEYPYRLRCIYCGLEE